MITWTSRSAAALLSLACVTGCASAPPANETATLSPKPARLQGIELPAEIAALMTELAAAYASGDPARIAPYLARDFRYQGMDQAAFLAHLKTLPPLPSPVSISVLSLRAEGDSATVVGYAEHAGGVLAPSLQALPLNAGAKLVREAGSWKLQGNGQATEQPLYRSLEGVTAQFTPADTARYQALLPAGLAMPAQPKVRVEMYHWTDMEPPQVPYRLAAISLRARHQDQEGWVLVSMPESDWLAVEAGRPIGFPKFVADVTLDPAADGGLRGQVTTAGQPLVELSYRPDAAAQAELAANAGARRAASWMPPVAGQPIRTYFTTGTGPFSRSESSHGWMTLTLGGRFQGMLADGTRAPATRVGFTGPMKLVLGTLSAP